MAKTKAKPTIVIDTREQLPYKFKDSVTKTLKSGDYSLLGLESSVAVERKTKKDAYGSCGKNRVRFEKELVRLSLFDYSAIVIEASLSSLLTPPPYSRMSPLVVVNSFVSWSVKYGIHVFFASNRKCSRNLVQLILGKYWKYRREVS